MAEKRPNRVLGEGHSQFWDYTAARELRIQSCTNCGALNWPAVPTACEHCGRSELTWKLMSGRGTIVSWCTLHQQYYRELETPWDSVLVELAEGPLFISHPKGFTNAETTQGMAVRVAFVECVDDFGEFNLPVFEAQ